jgi:hypothetical protein
VLLRNAGLTAANDAQLTLTLDAGLTPVSVGGNGPACTIASRAVTCPPFALAVGATPELLLTLQAGSNVTGPQRLFLHLASAALIEPQPGNNDATGTLQVTAPPPPAPIPPAPTSGGGGGGGRMDLGLIALLAGGIVAGMRTRRRTVHG